MGGPRTPCAPCLAGAGLCSAESGNWVRGFAQLASQDGEGHWAPPASHLKQHMLRRPSGLVRCAHSDLPGSWQLVAVLSTSVLT